MNIQNINTPDDINEIQCLECGAMAFGTELTQEDIDLLKDLESCLMCNAPAEDLLIILN